jgi:hypothetical protein
MNKQHLLQFQVIVLSAAVLLPSAVLGADEVRYAQILETDQSVTGVRGAGGADVVRTGSYQSGGATQGLLYRGYGPNTFAFDPGLGAGNVRVVGSYQQESTGTDN